jgi:AcrR family transcriptional regulator
MRQTVLSVVRACIQTGLSDSQEVMEVRETARERLVAVAGGLFYKDGYRGVGVDRLLAESGVAKATFYKHFKTKDDLIVAWIQRAQTFGESMEADMAATHAKPLVPILDAYIDIALRPACMGCTFQGTAAEFPDATHPAHAASLEVKRGVLQRFEAHARAEGVAEPKETAEMLYLLLEGVWATVRMFGPQGAPLAQAKKAVRLLAR